MPRFRTDRLERRWGRLCGVTDWMGGPSLAKVYCPTMGDNGDGLHRWAHITGEPDTYFSQPAIVNNGRQIIRGYLTSNDSGNAEFRVAAYNNTLPIEWRPTRAAIARRNKAPWLRWFNGRQSVRLLPWEAIRDCTGQGERRESVSYWLEELSFNAPPWLVRQYLAGYGIWDAAALCDHKRNLARLLWLWACDCAENKRRDPLYLMR